MNVNGCVRVYNLLENPSGDELRLAVNGHRHFVGAFIFLQIILGGFTLCRSVCYHAFDKRDLYILRKYAILKLSWMVYILLRYIARIFECTNPSLLGLFTVRFFVYRYVKNLLVYW